MLTRQECGDLFVRALRPYTAGALALLIMAASASVYAEPAPEGTAPAQASALKKALHAHLENATKTQVEATAAQASAAESLAKVAARAAGQKAAALEQRTVLARTDKQLATIERKLKPVQRPPRKIAPAADRELDALDAELSDVSRALEAWGKRQRAFHDANDELAKSIDDVAAHALRAEEHAKAGAASSTAAKQSLKDFGKLATDAKRAKAADSQQLANGALEAKTQAAKVAEQVRASGIAARAARASAQRAKTTARLGTSAARDAAKARDEASAAKRHARVAAARASLVNARAVLKTAVLKSLSRTPSGTDARTAAWGRMRYPWSRLGIAFQLNDGKAEVEAGDWKWSLVLNDIAFAKLPGVEAELALVTIVADARKGEVQRPMKAVFVFAGASSSLGTIVDTAIEDGRLEGTEYVYSDAAKAAVRWRFNGRRFQPPKKLHLKHDECEITQIDWEAFVVDNNKKEGNWGEDETEQSMAVPRLSRVSYGDLNRNKKPDALIETALNPIAGFVGSWSALVEMQGKGKCKLKVMDEPTVAEPLRPQQSLLPGRLISIGRLIKAKPGPGKPIPPGELALRYGAWIGRTLDTEEHAMTLAVPALEEAARNVDARFVDLDVHEGSHTRGFTLRDGRDVLIATNNYGAMGMGQIIAYDVRADRALVLGEAGMFDAVELRGHADPALEAHLLAFARDHFAEELNVSDCLHLVDWPNLTYDGTKLKDGDWHIEDKFGSAMSRLENVFFADLDLDKRDEAYVLVESHSYDYEAQAQGGTGHNRRVELHAFAAGRGCKPKPLGTAYSIDDRPQFVPGYVWIEGDEDLPPGKQKRAWHVRQGKFQPLPSSAR